VHAVKKLGRLSGGFATLKHHNFRALTMKIIEV